MNRPALLALAIATALSGCYPKKPRPPQDGSAPVPANATEATAEPADSTEKTNDSTGWTKSKWEASGRLVAIGDVHGDMSALREALLLAKLVDRDGTWVGGDATLVQTGDLLDRGDDERAILDYLAKLQQEASRAGGRIVLMNGNHEIMNVAGDLRYVTPGGFRDFADVEGVELESPAARRMPEIARARYAAFRPGGPYAKQLADRPVIAIVDDTVFAHGGVLPEHVSYGIDQINAESRAWILGNADAPLSLQGDTSPIWTRIYSQDPADCETLASTLTALGAQRMVVGHTPQLGGITSACEGKIWRVDVGMAAHYGGKPAALEIEDRGPRPLFGAGE